MVGTVQWKHRDELEGVNPVEGIEMRALTGENLQLVWVTLQPNVELPLHSHPHEQIGLVLEGVITMTIDGVTKDCGVGDGYVIPGGVMHSGKTGDLLCRVIDSFSPIRQEYKR